MYMILDVFIGYNNINELIKALIDKLKIYIIDNSFKFNSGAHDTQSPNYDPFDLLHPSMVPLFTIARLRSCDVLRSNRRIEALNL